MDGRHQHPMSGFGNDPHSGSRPNGSDHTRDSGGSSTPFNETHQHHHLDLDDEVMKFLDFNESNTLVDVYGLEDMYHGGENHSGADDADVKHETELRSQINGHNQEPNGHGHGSSIKQEGGDSSFKESQDRLAKLAFGRVYPADPNIVTTAVPEPSPGLADYLSHYMNSSEGANLGYNYRLAALDVPRRSRVETQIKCRLVVYPSPSEHLVHLPSDMIARPRLQLAQPFQPHPDTLSLDIDVVAFQDQLQEDGVPMGDPIAQFPLYMCDRCLSRERKRAFRKKTVDANEEYHWSEKRPRRLVLFNCKELLELSSPRNCELGGQQHQVEGRELLLHLRLTCYCRHHNSRDGFRLVFTLRNHANQVVGRTITEPILITDDHKESRTGAGTTTATPSTATANVSASFPSSSNLHSVSSSGAPSPLPNANGARQTITNSAGWPQAASDAFASTTNHNQTNNDNNNNNNNNNNNDFHGSMGAMSPSFSDMNSEHRNVSKRRRNSNWMGSTRDSISANLGLFSPPSDRDQQLEGGGIGGSHDNHNGGLNAYMSHLRGAGSGSKTPTAAAAGAGTITASGVNTALGGSTSSGSGGSGVSGGTSTYKDSPMLSPRSATLPLIQRIIPAQGTVRGGIEITLLGTNFYSGLVAKFGAKNAISTHCWSDSTIVAHLPPAAVPGPVIVTFEGITPPASPQIFTYVDDTDSQLIELALLVVGLKMNGRIEDAREIAMRIINPMNNASGGAMLPNGSNSGDSGMMELDTLSKEEKILRCIDLILSIEHNIPNWQLRNSEGQTMIHLAAKLGYESVVSVLMSQGARIDLQDVSGMTALHFAAMGGHCGIVEKLVSAHANPFIRTANHCTVMDVADESVWDLLPFDVSHRDYLRRVNHLRRSSSASTHSTSSNSHCLDSPGRVGGDFYLPEHLEMQAFSELRNRRRRQRQHQDSRGRSLSISSTASSVWPIFDDDSDFMHESDDEEEDVYDVGVAMRNFEEGDDTYQEQTSSHTTASSTATVTDSTNRSSKRDRSKISQYKRNISYLTKALSAAYHVNWTEEVKNYIHKQPYVLLERIPNHAIGYIPERLRIGITPMLSPSREPSTGSAPPAYEDLFPERVGQQTEGSSRSRSETLCEPQAGDGLVDKKASTTTLEPEPQQQQQQQPQDSEELEKWYEQIFVQTWVKNRKTWRNDKMLFLFWIPVLFIALIFMALRAYSTIWQLTVRPRRSAMRTT